MGTQPEEPCQALQFLDGRAAFLHPRFGFDGAFGDGAPEGSQHHP
jgi:hypothetical protein